MVAFIIRILGNSAAIYAAYLAVPGFVFTGGLKELGLAGLILGLLNLLVRPIVKVISFPIIILTLGLFTLVINALMLWLVDYFFHFIIIESTYALVIATIVIGIVNMIVSFITKFFD